MSCVICGDHSEEGCPPGTCLEELQSGDEIIIEALETRIKLIEAEVSDIHLCPEDRLTGDQVIDAIRIMKSDLRQIPVDDGGWAE